MKKRSPHITVLVNAVRDQLASLKPGDQISYADLSAIIGMDAQGPNGRAIVGAARKLALKNNNIVLLTIYGMGFERIQAPGYIEQGRKATLAIHRKAKLAYDVTTAISAEEQERLSVPQQTRLALHQAQLGRIASFTAGRRFETVAKRLDNQTISQQLAGNVVGDMFAKTKPKKEKKKLG